MDFWTRLIESIPNPSNRKDAAKDPAKRLNRFEKEYGQLLSIWRNSPNITADTEAANGIEARLEQLTRTLNDESQRPLPHPCIQFAAVKQIYVPITRIATTSYNKRIILQTVIFFATLIDGEEENFVENPNFSASLTTLLTRITGIGINTVRLGRETESRLVEVAFNITTKIRLQPEILPAWFKAGNDDQQYLQNGATLSSGHNRTMSSASRMSRTSVRTTANGRSESNHERFAGRTQKKDFPLFYVLMDYIHHEGKIGDFARTGLLYIIEAASSNVALEQWIVESDLSTLMATGLGAQYSQLSRKLVVDYIPDNLPPVLAFSDYEHPPEAYEVVTSCSEQFQKHLDAFLSHLLFWQDVLNHCKSVEVKSTLLEHFQVIFLQQLLYPSLLESSDIDGGSSVAVLTYLRRILESLDHPDMINLILHYLLALPNLASDENADEISNVGAGATETIMEEDAVEEDSKVSAARKRKSMDLATMLAETTLDSTEGPLLFNLVDLILACLRSHSEQTILVTLQLISSIIKRHHRYAVITLLRTESVPGEASHRTMGAHSQEVEYLMTLAGTIGGTDNFEELYEAVVKDTTTKVEGHLCSLKLVDPNVTTSNHGLPTIADSLPGAPREVRSHTLRPDDPLLNAALDHLETFLLNPVDMNLSLTETISDLAICGFMNIEGWLLRHPQKYEFDDNAADGPRSPSFVDDDSTSNSISASLPPEPDSPSFAEYQRKQQLIACRRRPKWTSLPRILVILEKLTTQVTTYRETIPRFDDLLQQRREAFQMADYGTSFPPRLLNEPPTPNYEMLQAPSLFPRSASTSRNTSPVRGLESLAQRILTDLGIPDLANSPSPPPPPPRGRKEGLSSALFPLDTRGISPSPSRGFGPGASGSSPGTARSGSVTPDTRRDQKKASKIAAFAAMDQSILSRKIGAQSGLKGAMKPVGLVLKLEHEEKMRARAERKERRVTITEGANPNATALKVPGLLENEGRGNAKRSNEISTEEIKAPPKAKESATEAKEETNPKEKGATESENKPGTISEATFPQTPVTEAPPMSPSSEGTPPAVPAKDSPKGPPAPPKETAPSTHTVASTVATLATTVTEGASTVTSPQSSIKRESRGETEVTVSHILTNVILLQSFLFELSALVQVRAGLFDEVRFV